MPASTEPAAATNSRAQTIQYHWTMVTREHQAVFYGTRIAWSETHIGQEDAPPRTPPIVLLHGSPGSRRDWDQLIESMSGTWRIIALDRPGYGYSGGASPVAASIAGNARVIGALIESEAPEGAIVVGYSHAGGVAILLAAMRPALIRGLVLVASIGSPHAILPSDFITALPLLGGAFSFFLLRLFATLAPGALARVASVSGPAPDTEVVSEMIRRSVAPRRVWKTYVREARSMIEAADEVQATLALIKAPALVVAGEDDAMVPLEASIDLAASIGLARLEVLEKTGHSLPLERPGRLAHLIVDFADGIAVDSVRSANVSN